VPVGCRQGDDDMVEQVLSVLGLRLVREPGSYLIILEPPAFQVVIAVTMTVGLSFLIGRPRLETAGLSSTGLTACGASTPRTDALPFFEYPLAAMALVFVLVAVRRCYACRYHA
jgi:hypothetical protein